MQLCPAVLDLLPDALQQLDGALQGSEMLSGFGLYCIPCQPTAQREQKQAEPAQKADYVLPAATYLEVESVVAPVAAEWSVAEKRNQAVAPAGEARAVYQIFKRLLDEWIAERAVEEVP